MYRYSIITTCKGRLNDLRQSLPQFLRQDDTEVIVVDYDCPDGTKEFVRSHFPSARVIAVENQPMFNLSHARNIGAQLATADVLIFFDADIIIADVFSAELNFQFNEPLYGTFKSSHGNSLRGSCVVRREDFELVEGYDELLSGYEGEDLDLYMRLRCAGIRMVVLNDNRIMNVFEQSDSERFRYRPQSDVRKQFLRGQLYQLAKEAVLNILKVHVLDLGFRKSILHQVDVQLDPLFHGQKDFKLNINFPDKYKRGLLQDWEFSTVVTVNARRIFK